MLFKTVVEYIVFPIENNPDFIKEAEAGKPINMLYRSDFRITHLGYLNSDGACDIGVALACGDAIHYVEKNFDFLYALPFHSTGVKNNPGELWNHPERKTPAVAFNFKGKFFEIDNPQVPIHFNVHAVEERALKEATKITGKPCSNLKAYKEYVEDGAYHALCNYTTQTEDGNSLIYHTGNLTVDFTTGKLTIS